MILRLTILALLLALCASINAAPTQSEIRQAMASYRAAHAARCEICGKDADRDRVLEVHHCRPQERFPELAASTNNMILVCRPCHMWVCHPGNFDLYTDDLREWLAARKIRDNKAR